MTSNRTMHGAVEKEHSTPRIRRSWLPYGRIFGHILTVIWCGFTYLFLLAPLVVIIGASFHGGSEYAVVVFPPTELSLKWYSAIPEEHYRALGLSLALAALTAIVACLLGVPAALGIVRSMLPGKPLIAALLRAPLQIPSIVIGVAFMQLYYAIGNLTGWYAVGTFWGLAVGHIFHTTPYVIGTTTAVLQRFDVRFEEAAIIHGASGWRTFRRVTLPIIMPGVYAGALYAFMMSFGDVPISMFLIAPGYTTFPVELFFGMENDFDPSILASSTLVILFSLFVMLLAQRIAGLDSFLKTTRKG